MCQLFKCDSSSANVFIILEVKGHSSREESDSSSDTESQLVELATRIKIEVDEIQLYYANSQLSFRDR